jgi:hypothetical protein
MSSYVKISQLNSLTFRNTATPSYQTFHNTLDCNENYPNFDNSNSLYHAYHIGDTILIQVATNNTAKTVTLINLETGVETDLTAAVAGYSTAWSSVKSFVTTDYDTVYFYQKTIYTSLLSGYYEITIEFDADDDDVVSELIRVYDCDEETVLYNWTNSETGLRKGIYFDGTQQFYLRIPSRFVTFEPGINILTNESFNNKLEALQSNALFYAILELDALPRFIVEKINVSLQVDTKKINGEQYEVESGIESEHIKSNNIATNIYTGSLKFRLYDYEIYPDFESEEEVETNYDLITEFNEDGEEEYDLIDDTDIDLIE